MIENLLWCGTATGEPDGHLAECKRRATVRRTVAVFPGARRARRRLRQVRRLVVGAEPESVLQGRGAAAAIGHDPEKWTPVFRQRSCPTLRRRAARNSTSTNPTLAE